MDRPIVAEIRCEQSGQPDHVIRMWDDGSGQLVCDCLSHPDLIGPDCAGAIHEAITTLEAAIEGLETPPLDWVALRVGALLYVPRSSPAAFWLASTGLWQARTPAEIRADYDRMCQEAARTLHCK
jgi:hypothetical protein